MFSKVFRSAKPSFKLKLGLATATTALLGYKLFIHHQKRSREKLALDIECIKCKELERQKIAKKINQIELNKLSNLPNDASLSSDEKLFLKTLKEGNALIKILKQQSSEDKFLHMLNNYNYRPSLRAKYSFDEHATYYKYVHMDNRIVRCRSLYEKAKRKASKTQVGYTHTKKTSTTLISQHLQTGLFGYKNIGLAFNINQCVIKAMFAEDTYTFDRKWASNNSADVIKYRDRVEIGKAESNDNVINSEEIISFSDLFNAKPDEKINSFTNLNEFKQFTNEKKFKIWNEVLAKVSREAFLGTIVDGWVPQGDYTYNRNYPAKNTKKLSDKVKKIFGKNMPLAYYNNQNQFFKIVSPDELNLRILEEELDEKIFSPKQNNIWDPKADSIYVEGLIDRKIKSISIETAIAVKSEIKSLGLLLHNLNGVDGSVHHYPIEKRHIEKQKKKILTLFALDNPKNVDDKKPINSSTRPC